MENNSFSKKRIIHIGIMTFILIMLIVIVTCMIIKYTVEGEKKLPFNIKKMNVISTAESKLLNETTDEWVSNIIQRNDISFTIEKNNSYKKNDTIKKIIFENFRTENTNKDFMINIYKPSTSVTDYIYSEEYIVQQSLEYVGGLKTNTETLQINNQGGTIGFSVIIENIGEYKFTENEKLNIDGRLLKKVGIEKKDIEFKLFFDIIIETDSGNKFKSNMELNLPVGDITQTGVEILEENSFKKFIFKRI